MMQLAKMNIKLQFEKNSDLLMGGTIIFNLEEGLTIEDKDDFQLALAKGFQEAISANSPEVERSEILSYNNKGRMTDGN